MTPETTAVKIGQKWKQKASVRNPERVVEVVEVIEPTTVKFRHKTTFYLVAISGFSNGKFTLVKDV